MRSIFMCRATELLFDFIGPDSYRDTPVLYFSTRQEKFHIGLPYK
jgi:hypothetical protein